MRSIELSTWLVEYIKQQKFKVLRDSKTHKALNVSYTEDGLKYTQDINRRWIYFTKAKMVVVPSDVGYTMDFKGNTQKSQGTYVEDFVPRLHGRLDLDKAELTWMGKAYRLCYNLLSNFDDYGNAKKN